MKQVKKLPPGSSSSSDFNPAHKRFHEQDIYSRQVGYPPFPASKQPEKAKGKLNKKPPLPPGYQARKLSYPPNLHDRKASYPSDLSDRKIYAKSIHDRKVSYPTDRPDRNISHLPNYQDRNISYPPGIQDRKISYPQGHQDRKIPYPPGHQDRKIPYPPGHQDRKVSYPPFPASKYQDFPERKFALPNPQFQTTESSEFSDRQGAYPSFYISKAPDYPDRNSEFQFESSSVESNPYNNKQQLYPPPPTLDPYPRNAIDWKRLSYFHNTSFSDHDGSDVSDQEDSDGDKSDTSEENAISAEKGNINVDDEEEEEEENTEEKKDDSNEKNEENVEEWNKGLDFKREGSYEPEDNYNEVDMDFSVILEDFGEKMADQKTLPKEKTDMANKLSDSIAKVNRPTLLKNLPQLVPLITSIAAENNFTTGISILNTINVFTHRFKELDSPDCDLTWLIRRLCTFASESRPSLRNEGFIVLKNVISGFGLSYVLQPFIYILNDSFVKGGPRIKSIAIDALTYLLLVFDNDCFDYSLLSEWACKMLWNRKRRVRQASLELIALISHTIGLEQAMEHFMVYAERPMESSTQSESENTAPEESSLNAIKARAERHSTPSVSFTVLVDYGLYIPFDLIVKRNSSTEEADENVPVKSENKKEPSQGADVDWILQGKGPLVRSTVDHQAVKQDVNLLEDGNPDVETPEFLNHHSKHYNSSSASTNSIRGNSLPQLYSKNEIRHFEPSFQQNFKVYPSRLNKYEENSTPSTITNSSSDSKAIKIYRRDSRYNKYDESSTSTPSTLRSPMSVPREINGYRRDMFLHDIYEETSTPSTLRHLSPEARELKIIRKDPRFRNYDKAPPSSDPPSSNSREFNILRRESRYHKYDETSTPSTLSEPMNDKRDFMYRRDTRPGQWENATPSTDQPSSDSRDIKVYRRPSKYNQIDEIPTSSTIDQPSSDSRDIKVYRRPSKYNQIDEIPTSSTIDQPSSDSRDIKVYRRPSRYNQLDEIPTSSTTDQPSSDSRDIKVYRRPSRYNQIDEIPTSSTTDQPSSDSRDIKVYRRPSKYNQLDEIPTSSTTDQPTSDSRDFKAYRHESHYNNLIAPKQSPPVQTTPDSRESRELRDLQELREFREFRKAQDVFEPREIRDARERKELQELRNFREFRESHELQEIRELREARDLRELQELRELRQLREPRDTQEFRELREMSRNFVPKNFFDASSNDDHGNSQGELFSYRKPELAKMHQQANRQQRPDDHNDIKLRNVSSGSSETSEKVSDEFLRNLKVTEYAAIPIPKTKKIKERKEKKLPKKKKKKKAPTEEKTIEEEEETSPLQKGLNKLNSTNWEVNMEGFANLTELIGSEDMKIELTLVNTTALRHLTNLRTQVCRVACAFYGDLFKVYGTAMESECEKILQKLLEKTADVNKFIREDATAAVMEACETVSYYEMFSCFEVLGVKHRNPLVRATTARMLQHLVTKHGQEQSLDMSDRLLPILFRFLLEGSLEIRTHAKEALAKLMDDITFNEKVKKFVTPDLRRATLKQINAIKKSCNIITLD